MNRSEEVRYCGMKFALHDWVQTLKFNKFSKELFLTDYVEQLHETPFLVWCKMVLGQKTHNCEPEVMNTSNPSRFLEPQGFRMQPGKRITTKHINCRDGGECHKKVHSEVPGSLPVNYAFLNWQINYCVLS